jgi:hypothetical protein
MHYVLIVLGLIWLAFLLPPPVAAIVALAILLVAFAIKTIASWITGMDVSFGAAVRAMFLSLLFFVLTALALVGGLQHLTFAVIAGLHPAVVPACLLGAYVAGFHVALPTNLGASVVVAVLSTLASVAILFGLRSVL